jgi:hypothetical protein
MFIEKQLEIVTINLNELIKVVKSLATHIQEQDNKIRDLESKVEYLEDRTRPRRNG